MLKRVLSFLSLLDSDGNLSLTNAALYVCLVKMGFSGPISGADMGALVAVIANYCHKRLTNSNADQ